MVVAMTECKHPGSTSEDEESKVLESDLRDLPASAKLVYKILDNEGELGQQQLAAKSRLPIRTVRHALARLDEVDAVTSRTSMHDARKSIYDAAEVTADAA